MNYTKNKNEKGMEFQLEGKQKVFIENMTRASQHK